MRTIDLLRLSTRMFKTRPLRTSLTILGVGVGIAATYFLVTFGYGLQKILLEQITTSESLLSLDVRSPESGILFLDQEHLDIFSKLEHVIEVSPEADIPTQISLNNFTGDALGQIVNPSYFRLEGVQTKYGRFFSDNDTKKVVVSSIVPKLLNMEPKEILGREVSVNLFSTTYKDDNESNNTNVTDEVEVHQVNLEIIGVVENEVSSFIYISQKDIPDIKITKFAKAKVRVEGGEFIDSVRQQIKSFGFSVVALSDTIDEANKIFQAIQVILALFGIVALVVAAIGMFNTVTIALLERTQEIGIMKAIGAGKTDMLIMFLTESSLMGFLGGVSGVVMGYLGGELINTVINLVASKFGGQTLALFERPIWFTATVIIFSTIIGFVTGLMPARRASRLNSLEALRYK